MTTRSIFQKICPACMITLPLDVRDCACGHLFDHDATDATLSSEEIRIKAEELYENYLAARAEQAASAVMAAQAEFARDPASVQKSQRVTDAIQESEAARVVLAAQSGRVVEMKKVLPSAMRAPHPMHIPAVPNKKNILAKPVSPPSTVRAEARVAHAPASTGVVTSVHPQRTAKKAVPIPIKSKPTPTLAKLETTPPSAVQSQAPNPAFRQAQAARAEKILRQEETAGAVKAAIKEEATAALAMVVIPKVEPQASSPAPVLVKSAPRLLATNKKECPNCTAGVDSKLSRCRCGYQFPASETLMPSLAMSEEERAEFTKIFTAP